MNLIEIKQYILSLNDVASSQPFGKDLIVYSINSEMFAILEVNKKPLRLSLRCDRQLAKVLKDRYEVIMPGHKLNQSKWITIVLSGQLNTDQIKDLINHSYYLVKTEST